MNVTIPSAGHATTILALLLVALPCHAAEPVSVVAVHFPPEERPAADGAVSFLDPASLAVLGTAPVRGNPWPLGYDASSGRLVVLGATPQDSRSGKSAREWSLSKVERASLESTVIGDVGFPPIRALVDPVRPRVYVLGESGKHEPAVLSVIDVAENRVVARLNTAVEAVDLALSPGGRRLYVLHGKNIVRRKQPPSKLLIFDPDTATLVGEELLATRALSIRVGSDPSRLFALSLGGTRDQGPGAQGKLTVLDAETGSMVARIDVGFEISAVEVDRRRGHLYVLGEAPAGTYGALTIVENERLAGRIVLPFSAGWLRLDPEGGRLYVLGSNAVVEIDPDTASIVRTFHLNFTPWELMFDPPRRRAFAAEAAGSEIAELNLDTGMVVGSHQTGRKGRKFGVALGSALLGMTTGVFVVGQGSTMLSLGAGGRELWAINALTNDVTIVDTEEHAVAGYVATGDGTRRILASGDGTGFWVESTDHLSRISASERRIVQQVELHTEGAPRGVPTYDLERGRILVPSARDLRCVDIATGETGQPIAMPRPVAAVKILHGRAPAAEPNAATPDPVPAPD